MVAAQVLLGTAPAGANGAAAGDAAALRDRVRAWRAAHEKEVVRELADLLALPNLAANREEIEANARHLVGMLERRGIAARVLRTGEAPPTVYGELRVPDATRIVVRYQVVYGGRGVIGLELTVYGATRALHSGN